MKSTTSPGVYIFRLCAGALGGIALVGHFFVSLALPTGPGTLMRIADYFSYFTIWTNILATAALVVPELASASRAARFLSRYEVRTALAAYMIMTCAVYALLLAGATRLAEIRYLPETALHYVMPPLYLIDWLLIRPEHLIAWKSVVCFLIFPILFGLYTLVRCALIGVYPYPFVDVMQLGYPAVLVTCLWLFLLILGLGLVLVAMSRRRARACAA